MRENGFATGIMYILMVLLAVGLAVLIFFNYQANTEQQARLAAEAELAATTPTPPPTNTPAPTPTPTRMTEMVTLAFGGDIVGQSGLTSEAQTLLENDDDGEDEDGEPAAPKAVYDYSDLLSGVNTSLTGSDFAACTLVGTLSADGPYDEGYRMNNAMATALAGAGFGLVNLATDHILDDGMEGLAYTVNAMTNEGVAVAGAARSEQTHGVYMANVHGVQVAVLSYTYGTGGVSVVENPWCVDIMTTDYMTEKTTVDYDRISADLAAVKEAGADVLVCFVYWWDSNQYYNAARDNETQVTDFLFRNGVDIVIGGGIKSPQPIETRVVEREDGTRANCVACYSLSNLMSCFNDIYTNLSAIAKIQITRDTDTGETWVSNVSFDPLFMLDTDDYSDYTEPGFKYRLLNAYDAMEAYDSGSSRISAEAYEAIGAGIEDLHTILGGEYDAINGGVNMDFPY